MRKKEGKKSYTQERENNAEERKFGLYERKTIRKDEEENNTEKRKKS